MLAFKVAGTPFGYHKFSGGLSLSLSWDIQLQYDACQVGISDRRGRWLFEWIDKAQADSFVVVSRDFRGFWADLVSYRRSWCGSSPTFHLCMLGPLYAWSAATASGTVGNI